MENQPIISPDGRHVWDGVQWIERPASSLAPLTNVPSEIQSIRGPAPGGLETHVQAYVARGYRVVSQTGSTAQLVKPKEFNALLFIILFLFCGVPAIIYSALYIGEKDKTVYLEAAASGVSVNGRTTLMPQTGGTVGGDGLPLLAILLGLVIAGASVSQSQGHTGLTGGEWIGLVFALALVAGGATSIVRAHRK